MSYEELCKLRKAKQADLENCLNHFNLHLRIKRYKQRQNQSSGALKRLLTLVNSMVENKSALPTLPLTNRNAHTGANNWASISSYSPGILSSLTGSPLSQVPDTRIEQKLSRNTPHTAKRKMLDVDDYQEVCAENVMPSSSSQHHSQQEPDNEDYSYPQQVGDVIILGPNNTTVDVRSYSSIIWSSSASATRQLLGFVFTSDILATHTLTGKPSPAFYGRERPAKMQLDPIKTADIIHCVRSKFNCSEREIRAAITTKCSDTSKKYKRRLQKRMELSGLN